MASSLTENAEKSETLVVAGVGLKILICAFCHGPLEDTRDIVRGQICQVLENTSLLTCLNIVLNDFESVSNAILQEKTCSSVVVCHRSSFKQAGSRPGPYRPYPQKVGQKFERLMNMLIA